MELGEFNNLGAADKENAVLKYGEAINEYTFGEITCNVFKLFDFYVGLYCELSEAPRLAIVARASQDHLPPIRSMAKISEN
jgi:hypothetical protein